MPKVTVIMNCYNSAEHLREAMDSVFRQSWPDWEIVFWDNCSTDDSAAIAQSYGEKVRYFLAEKTVPLGAARNLAIAKAEGSLLAFLDCDDEWLSTKLEKQVMLFDANPRLGLVSTDTEMFSEKGTLSRMFESTHPARGMVFRELMTRQWISMSSAMIRKSALDSLGEWFDESLNVCEEADVFYRIAKTWELDHVDEPLTRWRVHGVNTTFRKFGQFADETLRILDKHRKLYPGYDRDYPDLAGWWLLMWPRPSSACSGWHRGCPEASLIRFRSCISSSPASCANKKRIKTVGCTFSRFDCMSFSLRKTPEWILVEQPPRPA